MIRRLKDYYRLASWVIDRFVGEVVQVNSTPPLASILRDNPRLIGVFNHGPAYAPIIYCLTALKHYCQAGGADRIPVAITHRLFYKVPVFKQLATYFTQVDHAVHYEEFVKIFSDRRFNDMMVMPEGDNASFSDGLNIAPFRSHRFMDIAIHTQTPLLLCAQTGAESWCYPFFLSEKWDRWLYYFPSRIKGSLFDTRFINIPGLPKKIPEVRTAFKLITPEEWPTIFNDPNNSEACAEEVRSILQNMITELRASARIADKPAETNQ